MVGLWTVGGLEPEKQKAGQVAVCLRQPRGQWGEIK